MSDGTPIPIRKPDQEPRWLIWGLRFAAYAIPLGFLLYVLYWNFLPFGYDKTFTIDVGSPGDTSGEFYLEPSRDLSERKTAEDGTTYRELNGIAYAVFKPKAVLKNAQITVSVEGQGVSIIPPVIDFDPNSVQWDYAWNFSADPEHSNILKNVGMSTSGPQELGGNAYPFDGCMYFDGASRLELPDSADTFETGPFTVYAEWRPENPNDNFQQIVGHYNWELLQNKDSVSFQVGRMNDEAGPFYSVQYPITPEFFGQNHSVLTIYSPAATSTENGWSDLFLDGNFVTSVNMDTNKVYREYGSFDLSLGKSLHGYSNFFVGCVDRVSISNKLKIIPAQKVSFGLPQGILVVPLLSHDGDKITSISLHAQEK